MLTKDLILSYSRGDKIFPKFIRHEPDNIKPIEEALEMFDELVNASRKDVKEALQSIFNKYLTPKITQGMIAVITRHCKFEDEIRHDSILNRDTLFNEAAMIWKTEDSKNIPAAKHLNTFFINRFHLPKDTDQSALEEFLYPDIRDNRRLLEKPSIQAADILNYYNISQVQGVLMDACSATLILRKADNLMLRELLYKLRYLGLIFYIGDKRKSDRVTIHIEGPAVLKESARSYGYEFANVLPEVFKLRQTAWEFTAVIQSKKNEKTQKVQLNSGSGYLPVSHERGVWFKQELTDFIARWNTQNQEITANFCEEFFTDYSTACHIPDIIFTNTTNQSHVYLEWVRYLPADFITKINQSLPLLPKHYIFLFKGSKKKEAELSEQTAAKILAFRSVIPLQVLKTLISDISTDSQTVIAGKD